MNFSDAPTETRDGGTFFTREAEATLLERLRRENAPLLERLKGQ